MAVKVIGNVADIDRKTECHGCGSILQYRIADVRDGYTKDSRSTHCRYIECPRCKNEKADNPNIDQIGRVRV